MSARIFLGLLLWRIYDYDDDYAMQKVHLRSRWWDGRRVVVATAVAPPLSPPSLVGMMSSKKGGELTPQKFWDDLLVVFGCCSTRKEDIPVHVANDDPTVKGVPTCARPRPIARTSAHSHRIHDRCAQGMCTDIPARGGCSRTLASSHCSRGARQDPRACRQWARRLRSSPHGKRYRRPPSEQPGRRRRPPRTPCRRKTPRLATGR